MMPFRSTKLIAIVAVGVAGVALLLYGALWFVFARERAALHAEVGQYAAMLRAEARDTGLATLLADTAGKRARADALFVDSGAAVAFLGDLERIGERTSVSVTIVNVARNERAERVDAHTQAGVRELVVTLEARGSFVAVYRFLALIEMLPRPVMLSRASLSRGEAGGWNGFFELHALQHQ